MWTIAARIVIAVFFLGALYLAFSIAFDLFIRILAFNSRRRSQHHDHRTPQT